MNLMPNNWGAIRAFYADINPLILQAPSNEWAVGAYCWEEHQGMINFTPIEAWLWADIRQCGAVLWPQYPVLNIFVDFANPVAKVAIECDGAAYHLDKEKDAARDKRLTDAGWTVYRISGKHCRLESDEETGAPALPQLFIRRICELHDISRVESPKSDMPLEDFASMDSGIDEWWERAQSARAEALARKRGDL